MSDSLPPLLAIVGPTAVGKTALSIMLAQVLTGEVVSADSRQIYKQMDIGTAKPSPAERTTVPHWLIDIVNPDEEFSLALYVDLAYAALDNITQQRGRLPLLVGGTGQYLAALLEGWKVPHVPPQHEFRATLEREAEERGPEVLYERLRHIDPAATELMQPQNVRRIIRALEVYEVTGIRFSEQRKKQPPPYRILTLWLDLPRELLYARIDARVDAMIAAGLIQEVASLLRRGYNWTLPSMSSLGYRQFRPYFEAQAPLEDCIERLKFDTHAFARRQASWFRRLPNTHHLRADSPSLADEARRIVVDQLLSRH